MIKTRALLVAAVAMFSMVACSTADRSTPTDAPTTTVAGDLSIPEYYDTVGDLEANSDLIVEVTATKESIDEAVGRSSFAVTTVEVTDVLKQSAGVSSGAEINVRYLGRSTELFEGMPGPLVAGESYILFLQPFTFGDGRDTKQWVVVPPGQWHQTATGTLELDVVGGPEPMSELPETLDAARVEGLLAGD